MRDCSRILAKNGKLWAAWRPHLCYNIQGQQTDLVALSDLHRVISDIRPINQHLGWERAHPQPSGEQRTPCLCWILPLTEHCPTTTAYKCAPLWEPWLPIPQYLCVHGRRRCTVGLGGLSLLILSHTYVNAIKHLTGDGKSVGCGCLPSFRAHYHYLSSAKINQSSRCQRDERWMQLEAQMAGKGHATTSRRDHLI